MKLEVAQVIGLNTDQKAAQVISSQSGDNSFFAVLDLSCDDAFTRGRQVLSELSDFYWQSQELVHFDFEGAPSEKLNSAFEEIKKKFPTEEYSVLLAGISGKVLYLISKGEMEVLLKRGDKLSPLLSVGSSDQLISGFLEEGDRLLLSTKSLNLFLGDDLEKSFELPLETFEEEITARIGSKESENQGLAGLSVEIGKQQETASAEGTIPELDREEAPQSIYSEKLSRRLSRLKNSFPKSGKGRLILAGILILIIAVGAGYKFKISKDAKAETDFRKDLQMARDDFSAAQSLSSLDPAGAKNKLDLAKTEVGKALSLKPKDKDAQNLKKQIDDQSASILQKENVSAFPLFLDLDLVKKNFRATQMSLSSGKLLIMDPGVKTLVTIDVSKKSNQILAGEEALGDARFASINGGQAFVYSKDKGILRVDTQSQKVTTVAKPDSDWGNIKDIYGFAGNVYLLDSGKNMIWKYLPTAEGYSDKRAYLSSGTKVDFSDALRMQIESSVYVLKKSGEMLRFTKGDKDNFSYEGLEKGVKDPKSFFVSSDTDNLYVLDSENSRMLILTKTGAYKGQISGDEFGKATDLAVDEIGKKVYLLDGGKIFQVELK